MKSLWVLGVLWWPMCFFVSSLNQASFGRVLAMKEIGFGEILDWGFDFVARKWRNVYDFIIGWCCVGNLLYSWMKLHVFLNCWITLAFCLWRNCFSTWCWLHLTSTNKSNNLYFVIWSVINSLCNFLSSLFFGVVWGGGVGN